MIKIVHLITDLDMGGAEMMLYKLMSRLDRTKFYCNVISITSPGVVGKKIEALGIRVDTLGVNRTRPNPFALLKLTRIIRSLRPDIVQTWLYHADLLGTLACIFSGRPMLIWSLRCSNMDFLKYRITTRLVMKGCASFSFLPDIIIANSNAAVDYHMIRGYRSGRFMVIPNGFDTTYFKPDRSSGKKIRSELGIQEQDLCVGMIARFDPMKDHSTFFSAMDIIMRKRNNIHFIFCGEGMVKQNKAIHELMGSLKSLSHIHLLGLREDINKVMAGLTICVLSSYGESFPNVIGEAMACGVPCVVTEVGDSGRIVGESGRVVPPKDPSALADAILELLDLPEERLQDLGILARERVSELFSLDKVVAAYEDVYQNTLKDRG